MLFFDYANTLVVHPNKIRYKSADSYTMSTENLLRHTSEYCYGKCIIPTQMYSFVKMLAKRRIPLYCISFTSCLRIVAKESYLNKTYDGVFDGKCLAAASNEEKADIIKQILIRDGVRPSECIVVDDNRVVRDTCANLGTIVINPMEILCSSEIHDIDKYPFVVGGMGA